MGKIKGLKGEIMTWGLCAVDRLAHRTPNFGKGGLSLPSDQNPKGFVGIDPSEGGWGKL